MTEAGLQAFRARCATLCAYMLDCSDRRSAVRPSFALDHPCTCAELDCPLRPRLLAVFSFLGPSLRQ